MLCVMQVIACRNGSSGSSARFDTNGDDRFPTGSCCFVEDRMRLYEDMGDVDRVQKKLMRNLEARIHGEYSMTWIGMEMVYLIGASLEKG